jgi:hypothetical protein
MESKMRLRFNRRKAAADLRKAVKSAADQCLKEFYSEIRSGMNTGKAKTDLHRMREDEENYFRRMVVGYADAVLDSYGTGSLMDTLNPFFSEYKNSTLWNPARNALTIVGRYKGFYIDIYGRKQYSSGKRAGRNIESKYKPQRPSYAFQRAEKWWCVSNGRVNEILNRKIREWVNGMGQYFDYR